MNEGDAVRALARTLVSAMESYDSAGVRECYAPDMRFWHNAFDTEMSGGEHIKLMEKHYFHRYLNPKYINSRIDLIEGGFVLQHILTARLADDGGEVRMPICVVARVKDGRITRIDEYLTMAPSRPAEI